MLAVPLAQRHMLLSGTVLPSLFKEYSTAMGFVLLMRLAINPVDSRSRRVLVNMRWETFPIAAQVARSMMPFFYREQNLRRPSANKNCQWRLRSRVAFIVALVRSVRVIVGHEINLTLGIERMGVTSVAGFRAANLYVKSERTL